jgi:hypothetical protein
MSTTKIRVITVLLLNVICITTFTQEQERMDEMWGSSDLQLKDAEACKKEGVEFGFYYS